MPFYTVTVQDVASSASADTFKTLAALVAANTAGHRARLVSLDVGVADDTPGDTTWALEVARVASVSGGSAGTGTAATPAQVDPRSKASDITATVNHTVEPSTLEAVRQYANEFNSRASVHLTWDAETAPKIEPDMLLAIRVAPRSAAARQFTASATFEQY